MIALTANLIRLREQAGYKQAKDFARAAGIPYSSYIVYEKGSWPNEKNLLKIARALHVSIDTLLGYEQKGPSELEIAIKYLKEGGVRFAPVSPAGTVSIYVGDFIGELLPSKIRDMIKKTPIAFPIEKILDIYQEIESQMSLRKALILPEITKNVIKGVMLDDLINAGYAGGIFNSEIPKEGIEIHSKPKK